MLPGLLPLLLLADASLHIQGSPSMCASDQMTYQHTVCTSCAASPFSSCPDKFHTHEYMNCSYTVQIGGRQVELPGCHHLCTSTQAFDRKCCPDHWGVLCLVCPKWSGKTCNDRGICLDGREGNGTCLCDEGFAGFACQKCSNPNAYSSKCDRECDCVNGICDGGPDGSGKCLCQPPYTGSRCNQVSSICRNCTAYSYCREEGGAAMCDCLPGYRRTTRNTCAAYCSARECHAHAECSLSGSKVKCVCKADYEGDGKLCLPKNPCSVNNGGCPPNSTICVLTAPNNSSCECMKGMVPLGSSPQTGCQLASACSLNTCHFSAVCQTGQDGSPRCECEAGQLGDGWRCYGNLMERLLELDATEPQRGNLSGAVALFEKGCDLTLSQHGPFTMFVPLIKTPLTGVNEEEVCKRHLVVGQHLYRDLEGQDFNLYGGDKARSKGDKRFILLAAPQTVYTIIQKDLPAANGIIHLIDQPITAKLPDSPHDEQYSDKTIGEVLTLDRKFNRFLSLVDNCGAPLPLRGPGPLTVFIPTNEAVDRNRDGSIIYMLDQAKHKLQELLKHHMFSQASLTVDELASLPQIQTMANQIIQITVSHDGKILLGEGHFPLQSTNIVASNGIIHMLDGLLIPPSIIPIMPKHCDVITNKITVGPCVSCSYLYQTHCPEGSTELDSHLTGCDTSPSPDLSFKKGCAKYCNTTTKVAECCKGFYGPDCKPCIGGFQHPCYDKGTCFDGIHGNGTCSCHSGLRGVACHICDDPSKHGENCDEDCLCVHGVCDNRPGSRGVCRRGSCVEGYSGEYCDRTAVPCASDEMHRHCHIHAYCTSTENNTTCVCRDGYDGDGLSCSPINPCLKSNRGGCDTNARCDYMGPGNALCVCNEGWQGDGRACVEIDNCQLPNRGGCSPNADCKYIGPGQSICECKRGYMGNGIVCDLINPCSQTDNGGCHALAKCEQKNGNARTCTCPDGFVGDGMQCYGTILDELDMNYDLYSFNSLIQMDSASSGLEYLTGNVTVLVPSRKAMRNFSSTTKAFWTNRHRLSHFIRAHILPGIYSAADLESMIGIKVLSLNPPTTWPIRNQSGVISVGNASIVTPDLRAINGYIHVIDQVLAPPLSDLPPEHPTLMEFLNATSNFTLFRQHVLLYNLSEDERIQDFTLLLPTDDAIRRHLHQSNSTLLEAPVVMYHYLRAVLLPDQIKDGLLTDTLLGAEYQVQFHLKNNQTAVNDVPLDGGFIETQYGVILVLSQVLRIQKNRCSKTVMLQGRCTDCGGPPHCLSKYKPIRSQFPANMASNCRYSKRVGTRRKYVKGCVIKCLHVTTDHSCCHGYYGHECFKCPGDGDNWCFNHGECQDGNLGNGECRCYEGFHGTACEECEPGRYGVNCSNKCVCDHGRCDDGLTGTGRCDCYKGWKGGSCSVEIKDDSCGGVCHENANCITGPMGSSPACVCSAGYEGNGTHCKELDVCDHSNGGCSQFAVCTKISAGERSCTCIEGYTGDGVICLEIDGCLFNNGGCHEAAECTRTGPNTTACSCLSGFTGSGRYCFPANPCIKNNGGCGKGARCRYLGQGQRNCTCTRGYVGDGIVCRGKARMEISQHPEFAYLDRLYQQSSDRFTSGCLYGNGPFTVFAPAESTNIDFSLKYWHHYGRVEDLMCYHVVSCEALSLDDLRTTNQAISLSGHTLQFTLREGSVYINNVSKIISGDFTTADGVIHLVEKVLMPYDINDKTSLKGANAMNFTTAAEFYGYRKFSKMIKDSGLLPLLQLPIHQPLTMLWPTDQALSSLPRERQLYLSIPENTQIMQDTVKAHIIRNIKLTLTHTGSSYISPYRSMHGSRISYSCDKNLVGAVLIDNNNARVVERSMVFQGGVAFGIDQLLEPPGLGAHCDGMTNKTVYGRCGSCFTPPPCPLSAKDTGQTDSCRYPHYNSHRYGDYGYPMSLTERDPLFYWHRRVVPARKCRRVCLISSWTSQCCKNHYGRSCEVCPGGVEAPCGHHGSCMDGVFGKGNCVCHKGFKGTACEHCQDNYYGANCTECDCAYTGICVDGMLGSGECVCQKGWQGPQCGIKTDSIPLECRQCHNDAVCVPGVGCHCKDDFQGNGTYCAPMPAQDLCSEYNGGCHGNADCNQTGNVVNCTCQDGYRGDGFTCEPANRCVEEVNGGCSDFATCKFTGPNERQCECLPGYIGNGVQCLEKVVPPIDRCLEYNGGCDSKASCKDLHYHANTAGVFHLRSPEGKYRLNTTEAEAACLEQGASIATFKQLADAQQLGLHLCVAGWLAGGQVGYPTRFPSAKCGDNHVGVVLYKEPVDPASKFDTYCYRLSEVSCVCNHGYVGDGVFCNGVVVSVLATYSNFSLFYKMLLDYGDSSSDGKQLLDFLSHRQSDVLLFVPHNAGFTSNQTLNGRDLEYHISANQSRRLFQDLIQTDYIITTRLGLNLTVTQSNNQSFRLNGKVLLEWDIPASNGIIHVIETPLTAPPLPGSHNASEGHSPSGAWWGMLLSVLLVALLAGGGYYIYRQQNNLFRFNLFRNEDEGRAKPVLVSFPNPLYSGQRVLSDPFADQQEETESDPPEPPTTVDQ